MQWFLCDERDPRSAGVYGVSALRMCFDLDFAYWDGKGWIPLPDVGKEVFPYRSPLFWCKLEWGKDEN